MRVEIPHDDYHILRWTRTAEAIREHARGRSMVDIGCRAGVLATQLKGWFDCYVGLDLDLPALKAGRPHAPPGASLVCGSFDAPPLRDAQFDVVVAAEIIEHVAHPDALLRACRRLAKPDGMILITTPNWRFLGNRLPSYEQITDRKALEARQFKPDADGHLFLFTAHELARLANAEGLRITERLYLQSPAVTGHLMARYLVRYLPQTVRATTDALISRVPVVRHFACAGLMVVMQPC